MVTTDQNMNVGVIQLLNEEVEVYLGGMLVEAIEKFYRIRRPKQRLLRGELD